MPSIIPYTKRLINREEDGKSNRREIFKGKSLIQNILEIKFYLYFQYRDISLYQMWVLVLSLERVEYYHNPSIDMNFSQFLKIF